MESGTGGQTHYAQWNSTYQVWLQATSFLIFLLLYTFRYHRCDYPFYSCSNYCCRIKVTSSQLRFRKIMFISFRAGQVSGNKLQFFIFFRYRWRPDSETGRTWQVYKRTETDDWYVYKHGTCGCDHQRLFNIRQLWEDAPSHRQSSLLKTYVTVGYYIKP